MRILTVLITFLFALALNAQQGEAKRYLLKSGFVKYNLSGNTVGTRTLFWDDYGEKTREEIKSITEIKMFGMKSKEETNTIDITVGDQFWTIDLKENTGQKGTIPTYEMSKDIAEGMTEAESKKIEEELLDALNGERLGTELFLGKECEVIKIMGSKAWIYKGLLLKSTAKMLGVESNEIATEIKENISVSSDKFVPMADIQYEDVDELQQSIF